MFNSFLNLWRQGTRHYLRHYRDVDNLHLFLWLLKDICWLKQWHIAGTIMIAPNIFIASWGCWHTRKHPYRLIANLSVLCWMSANSMWMLYEFFLLPLELLAMSLFILGCALSLIALWEPVSAWTKRTR